MRWKLWMVMLCGVAAGQLAVVPPAQAAAVKAVTSGAVDRDGQPAEAAAAAGVDSWVVTATWSQLQDRLGGPLHARATDGTVNPIDAAVSAARTYNASHPGRRARLKLRVYAGVGSPRFALVLGGGPMHLVNCTSATSCSAPADVPVFWSQPFVSAYRDLLTRLGALYDGTAEIGDVVVCGSAVIFCDGTKQMNDGDNAAQYRSAGYAVSADVRAQKQFIDAAASAFPRTPVEQAQFHFQFVNTGTAVVSNDDGTTCSPGKVCHDFAYNYSIISYQEKTLGSRRAVLSNYSLQVSRTTSPDYAPLYRRFADDRAAGKAVVTFQTATLNKIDMDATAHGLCDVLRYAAVTEHASSVELPKGYSDPGPGCALDDGTTNSIAHWDAVLRAN